jgi:UDP-N-acetylglucosamine 2-epimerase (non-hydrolysing)
MEQGEPLKVLVVFGTRPEAIKLAPVIRELRARSLRSGSGIGQPPNNSNLTVRVCVTGQHREMLDQVLQLFEVSPDYDLKVMEGNQTPTQVAAAVLSRLEPIFGQERPDWVLVQGDTTTVAAAALGAFYAHARVGHVEAGLRTQNKWQPFPEEINRRVAGAIADLHFAATDRARNNLLQEGVPADRILVTGNPVIDSLQWVARLPIPTAAKDLLQQAGLPVAEQKGERARVDVFARAGHSTPAHIFVTAHRRENFGLPLEQICLALRELADRYAGRVRITYAVHLNPNVWQPVHRLLGGHPSITLTPPLDYLATVHLIKNSYLVMTDSGGIQEEAPSLGKPVLVLREVTERPEGVEAGIALVVGVKRERIVEEAARLIEDANAYSKMAMAVNPYGDGKASHRIVQALLDSQSIFTS